MPTPTEMYPLRFSPIFRRYLWGGRRLDTVLEKSIGRENAAESWEIVDHGDDQSAVLFGPLSGMSLRKLVADAGSFLLGDELHSKVCSLDRPAHLRNRFPLLLKFLDANRPLSVQVHPDDSMGQTLSPPDLGKTEAWIVLHAEPGAEIFAGLKNGVTRESFQASIESGDIESTLHRFPAKTGDAIFIPAGTVHALGAGLLIAEIQQASDTTFRIYDWGRVEHDGRPRELHIAQALKAIRFDLGPVAPERPISNTTDPWQTLVTCDQFSIARGIWNEEFDIGNDDKFHLVTVIAGSASASGDPSGRPLNIGETVLLPAGLGPTTFTPGHSGVEILEFHVPHRHEIELDAASGKN